MWYLLHLTRHIIFIFALLLTVVVNFIEVIITSHLILSPISLYAEYILWKEIYCSSNALTNTGNEKIEL